MKRSTFTKKTTKRGVFHVPGTHPSIHNGLLLVSTGVPTLDDVLGGGLPVGSVMLIEEDAHNRYAKLLLKYFLAEGVMSQHGIYLASACEKPEVTLEHLPKPVSSSIQGDSSANSGADNMKIAFMYKDLPKNTPSLSSVSKYGHYYDISCAMDTKSLESCNVKTLDLSNRCFVDETAEDTFRRITRDLKQHIDNNVCHQPPKTPTDAKLNVLRLALPSLASPLWCENCENSMKHIARFLHCLRALARNSLLVCMVTIPTHLYTQRQVATFRQLVDCSIELKAFIGEKNPAFKQYHGLFNIHKLPCVNSLTSFVPESFDLAFELKRTKFVIELLHLPPDISETASRQGMDESTESKIKTSTPCGGTSLRKDLDF